MALRIEEDLDMAHRIGFGAAQIGIGQVVKIGLGLQDRHALIIDIEKILQIAETVSFPYSLYRCERDRHPVALR